MAQKFVNNLTVKLIGDITTTQTTITVDTTSRFPLLQLGDWFYLTITDKREGVELRWEVVKVNSWTGTTLTCVRAQDGTTAQSWLSGSELSLRITAADMFDYEQLKDSKGQINGIAPLDPAGKIATNYLYDVVNSSTQTALNAKLPSASYTAADVLAKVKTVDGADSGLDADTLDGLDSTAFTRSGSSVSLTGDVTGTATVSNSGAISIATTIAANSVALGTDTTGNYVAGLTQGTGIVVSGTAGEGWSPTITNSAPNVTTDISITHNASAVVVNSSDGTDGTINAATTALAGVMSSTDKTKLDGIATGANNYTHPTGDGNLHVPATGTTNNGKVLTAGATAGSLSWTAIPAAPISSVAGKTGAVTLVKGDVGLANVDNTSDADKPVSTATQTALNAKQDKNSVLFSGDLNDLTTTGLYHATTALTNAPFADTTSQIRVSNFNGVIMQEWFNPNSLAYWYVREFAGGWGTWNKILSATGVTNDRVLVSSNNPGGVVSSNVSSTELNYLSGVTSAIQTQLNNKAATTSIFGFKNHIINGNFDIWQRGTSQTMSGYGSDDRWVNLNIGSTKTHSRIDCTDTERALFNASVFSRTVVSSVAGAGNAVVKAQYIEDVTKLAGKTVTLSFWAKANSNKNIAIEFGQRFGTGGTPSTDALGIGSQLIALTTTWQKKTITVTLPSIVGKTLGTDGVDTTSTRIVFWFDAGSSFNSRSANLGQQSGTFDIAQVQLEEGSVATPFEQRPIGLEYSLCYRYFEIVQVNVVSYGVAGMGWGQSVPFKETKRVTPTVEVATPTGHSNIGPISTSGDNHRFTIPIGTVASTGVFGVATALFASAEL